MEMFCKDLREHATEIINCEKKEMIPLTNEENELMKCKKFFTYAKNYLILIKTMKMHLNYIIK